MNENEKLKQESLKKYMIIIGSILLLLAVTGVAIAKSGWIRKARSRDGFVSDISKKHVPEWGNGKEFIAIHYTGMPEDGHSIPESGVGAHFYIYSDGTIYQAVPLDAVMWQVGTGGYYTRLREDATNYNCIGIEMCPRCDGDKEDAHDETWYFTTETQEAAVRLVRRLMSDLGIPADHILRHGDIVDKWCPAPYFNNNHYKTSWTWDEFLAEVSRLPESEVPEFPIA